MLLPHDAHEPNMEPADHLVVTRCSVFVGSAFVEVVEVDFEVEPPAE